MRSFFKLLFIIAFSAIGLLYPQTIGAQTAAEIYKAIKANPSTIRWCLHEAGDDEGDIIGSRCKVYLECLANISLDETVDQRPFPQLTSTQVEGLRKCHQALYNSSTVNPQIKGSAATQHWLLHDVYAGTEAKSFSIPSLFPSPH